MDEPSVLDYVKAKIMPWKYQLPEIKIESTMNQISDEQNTVSGVENGKSITTDLENEIKIRPPSSLGLKLPPSLFLVMMFAILGQLFLEPSNRSIEIGIFFYIVSFVILLLTVVKKDKVFDREKKIFSGQINTFIDNKGLIALGISFTSLLIAFFTFKETGFHDIRFNYLNLFFWILSIISFCYAILDKSELINELKNIINHFDGKQLLLRITPWVLLSFISILLIMFFRFFRLNQVPGEMFSDHAEKLLDVVDVLNGDYHVFFVRNTGREFIQFYLTAIVSIIFKTGISFLSLKIGTALAGFLTLPYIYKLGKELGNRWVGILAFLFAGISYWHNVISRVGLRFPLYPLFAAPALFYLIRGIRQKHRNDFVFAGIALGLGLHGYSSFRLVPIVLVFVILLYLLHEKRKTERTNVIFGLIIIIIISFIIFLPLFKFTLISPADVNYRSLTRLGTIERNYPEPIIKIFSQNLVNALTMFFYSDGNTWVHSIPFRPALDYISAAFLFIGSFIVAIRYIKHRNWEDLFLILAVPLLLLPSILSLAFPEENPSLNRTGGAIIPVFILVAIGFEGVFSQMWHQAKNRYGKIITISIGIVIFLTACINNYDLLFRQYDQQFLAGAWNSSQIGDVVKGFTDSIGNIEDAYVVPYPHWVDTRLVGINAGFATRDLALWPEQFTSTLENDHAKLFIVKPENNEAVELLQKLYPGGSLYNYDSDREGKDFLIFSVSPQAIPVSTDSIK
jgi:hypothetical protein